MVVREGGRDPGVLLIWDLSCAFRTTYSPRRDMKLHPIGVVVQGRSCRPSLINVQFRAILPHLDHQALLMQIGYLIF